MDESSLQKSSPPRGFEPGLRAPANAQNSAAPCGRKARFCKLALPFLAFLIALVLSWPRVAAFAQGGGSTSPHQDYNTAVDACATCHRVHSGQSARLLTSADANDSFCFACHDGTGAAATPYVSTHANVDYSNGVEASFRLRCVQCHNPHGSNNLYAVKEQVVVQEGETPETVGPVSFTATTGINSYDDGSSVASSRLCVACHVDARNAGYPMTNHPGGANHLDGFNYVRQDCITCHPHSADADRFTADGFMPAAP